MALMKCPECGKEMSSTALSCPHCGAPNKQEQVKEESKKSNQLISTIGGILMLCVALFGDNFGITDSQKLLFALVLLAITVIPAIINAKSNK